MDPVGTELRVFQVTSPRLQGLEVAREGQLEGTTATTITRGCSAVVSEHSAQHGEQDRRLRAGDWAKTSEGVSLGEDYSAVDKNPSLSHTIVVT